MYTKLSYDVLISTYEEFEYTLIILENMGQESIAIGHLLQH